MAMAAEAEHGPNGSSGGFQGSFGIVPRKKNDEAAAGGELLAPADAAAASCPPQHWSKLKEQGNEAFKKQDFDTAVIKYTEALTTADPHGIAQEIRQLCLVNRAACYLKLGKSRKVRVHYL